MQINNDQFRISSNKEEIFSILEEVKKMAFEITLWQTIREVKNIIKGKINNVDINNDNLSIFLTIKPNVISLNEPILLYYKSQKQSFLYKTIIKRLNETYLIIKFPLELRIFENREHPRHLFKDPNNPVVLFKDKKSTKYLNALLGDISDVGVSLLVTKKDCVHLQTLMMIDITDIGKKKFEAPLELQILYIKSVNITLEGFKRQRYRVGLKFKNKINSCDIIHDI
ncbi:MAG: hypothetical protein HQK51_09835 [Oligoflexia bacterium]|nr:hypothetical protein [Oligoflexia bacterium]